MKTENDSFVQEQNTLTHIVAKHVSAMEPVLADLERNDLKKKSLRYMVIDVRISLDEVKNSYFAEEDDLLQSVKDLGVSVNAFANTIEGRIKRRGTEIKKSKYFLIRKCVLKMQQLELKKIASKTEKLATIYKSLAGSIKELKSVDLNETENQIDE